MAAASETACKNGRRVKRPRVLSSVRYGIVQTIVHNGLTGAEAARAHGVSEATVHRIMKAEQEANPAIALVLLERSSLRGDRAPSSEVVPKSRSRKALTEEQQLEIVRRVAAGTDLSTDLALEFGVHKSTVSRILRGFKAQSSSVVIKIDPSELNKRVAKGIAKAVAAGRRSGPKSKLSTTIQNEIGEAATLKKETLESLAQLHGVNPSTISRIVRKWRRKSLEESQSLEEMFRDISEIRD